MQDRHYKQEIFQGLGKEGQEALKNASVLIAGCGATGGTEALLLIRAGVGRVRVVDRDFAETGNLGRQLLFTEDDVKAGMPKAILAEQTLLRMNSEVAVEGTAAHIDCKNISSLAKGVDLIVDGLDNQETRYLINDLAVKRNIPWVFAGCIGSSGNVMAIRPGITPCLRCIFPKQAPAGSLPTCDTAGIIGPAASLTASIAAAEAMKILSGQRPPEIPKMITFDLWSGVFRETPFTQGPRKDCPCCGKRKFDYLSGKTNKEAEILCGAMAVQINTATGSAVNLDALANRLPDESILSRNEYLLRFKADEFILAVFPDGRIVVQGTADPAEARAAADRWVGL